MTQEQEQQAATQPEVAESNPTLGEAQAMIDQVVAKIGLDPRKVEDSHGWRHLMRGDVECHVGITRHESGAVCFEALSPLFCLPAAPLLRNELCDALLRLNHSATLEARFSLDDKWVVAQVMRPIYGLDADQVLAAIHTVTTLAEYARQQLAPCYDLGLPDVPLSDEDWPAVVKYYGTLEPHARAVMSRLLEGWSKQEGVIGIGQSGLSLTSQGEGHPILADLRPGGLIAIEWGSLSRTHGLSAHDVEYFKSRVPRPPKWKSTESSAHLRVTEGFTLEMAEQLLDALQWLDATLQGTSSRPAAVEPAL